MSPLHPGDGTAVPDQGDGAAAPELGGGPAAPGLRRPRRRLLFWPALLLLLAGLPFTAGRLSGGGGELHPFLVRLAALSPFGGLFALAAAVVALAAGVRRWRGRVLAALALLLLLVHVGWLVPVLRGQSTAVDPDGPGVVLRVLALNAHDTADPAQIVRLVREQHVDVLALSETGDSHYRQLQAAGLGSLLPYSSDRLRPRVARVGGDTTVVRSRYPVTVLAATPVTGYLLPRVRLAVPGAGVLNLVTVHLASPRPDSAADWRADLARIGRLEAQLPSPAVLAGDFNSTRDHRYFRQLLGGRFVDSAEVVGWRAWPGLTWPAGRHYPPAGRLDHVLITGDSVGVRSVTTVAIDRTDHRGVLATLVLPRRS